MDSLWITKQLKSDNFLQFTHIPIAQQSLAMNKTQ